MEDRSDIALVRARSGLARRAVLLVPLALAALVPPASSQERVTYADAGWRSLLSGQGCARKCFSYGEESARVDCGFDGDRGGTLRLLSEHSSAFGRLRARVEARATQLSHSWGIPDIVCAYGESSFEDRFVVLGGIGAGTAVFRYELRPLIDSGDHAARIEADVAVDGIYSIAWTSSHVSFEVSRSIVFGQAFPVHARLRARLTMDGQAAPWSDASSGCFELVIVRVEAFDSGGGPVSATVEAQSGTSFVAPAEGRVRLGSGVNELALFERAPAILGGTWVGQVQVEGAGVPGLLVAGLGGPTGGLFIRSGYELLCQGPFLRSSTDPAGHLSVAVPPDPALIGQELALQAATTDPGGGLRLTNALDVRVGTY